MKRCVLLALGTATAWLLAPAALAGSVSQQVPINAVTLSSCEFDSSNVSPNIDLDPAYEAAVAYTGSQGSVTLVVFCNSGTPIATRTLTASGGSTSTPGQAAALTETLDKFGPAPLPDTVDVKVWFTAAAGTTVFSPPSNPYLGATRYSHTIFASWVNDQWGASSGQYGSAVEFTVTF